MVLFCFVLTLSTLATVLDAFDPQFEIKVQSWSGAGIEPDEKTLDINNDKIEINNCGTADTIDPSSTGLKEINDAFESAWEKDDGTTHSTFTYDYDSGGFSLKTVKIDLGVPKPPEIKVYMGEGNKPQKFPVSSSILFRFHDIYKGVLIRYANGYDATTRKYTEAEVFLTNDGDTINIGDTTFTFDRVHCKLKQAEVDKSKSAQGQMQEGWKSGKRVIIKNPYTTRLDSKVDLQIDFVSASRASHRHRDAPKVILAIQYEHGDTYDTYTFIGGDSIMIHGSGENTVDFDFVPDTLLFKKTVHDRDGESGDKSEEGHVDWKAVQKAINERVTGQKVDLFKGDGLGATKLAGPKVASAHDAYKNMMNEYRVELYHHTLKEHQLAHRIKRAMTRLKREKHAVAVLRAKRNLIRSRRSKSYN